MNTRQTIQHLLDEIASDLRSEVGRKLPSETPAETCNKAAHIALWAPAQLGLLEAGQPAFD